MPKVVQSLDRQNVTVDRYDDDSIATYVWSIPTAIFTRDEASNLSVLLEELGYPMPLGDQGERPTSGGSADE